MRIEVHEAAGHSVWSLLAEGGTGMLWTIFVILLILWLLGLVSGHTMGGVIHVLLVIAIIVLVVRLIQGRRVL
jgi:uncharacterized membrane protein YtjA (UPF0391 family)